MQLVIALLVLFTALSLLFMQKVTNSTPINNTTNKIIPSTPAPTPMPSPIPTLPVSHVIPQKFHVYQSFNNCGPASLSMLLSYFGIDVSQEELGRMLRPYQNPRGDNDDKSVTLDELANAGKKYRLIPYHRPDGNIDLLKQFIARDIPVITRTLLKEGDDIGHYRLIRGYDNEKNVLIQDDSLQGKNLSYTYQEFNSLWKIFNYEYLVLVPAGKIPLAQNILGENNDEKKAWTNAVLNARKALSENPQDIYTRFNLSVALYNIGEYRESVSEYEKVADLLPFRTLWYQIEPIQAYAALGRDEKVFSLTDKILNNGNRAFSELYLIRGEIYQKQGKSDRVREELKKAVLYNQNFNISN